LFSSVDENDNNDAHLETPGEAREEEGGEGIHQSAAASPPPDWYNMTAIGRDEPLEKNREMNFQSTQRPSMRRSVSGDISCRLPLLFLTPPSGGTVSDRTVGDAITPPPMGRNKSAGHLTLEAEVTNTASAGALPHTRSRSFSGDDRISLTGAGKYVHHFFLFILIFLPPFRPSRTTSMANFYYKNAAKQDKTNESTNR
jgi:hypothetical protein